MIYVVSGLVGTGKSYHCSVLGIDHLLSGGVVATNMSLDLNRIMDTYHRRLLPWQLVKVDAESDPRNIPRGDMRGSGRRRVMVILDEALNWFASSAGAKDERKCTWAVWLRQSDKLGQDVYFVAQTFERSAKWIRELAQVALRITNFRNFHFLRMPIGRWLHLDHIYCVAKYDINSLVLLNLWFYRIQSRVYNCYCTSELYGFTKPSAGYLGSVAPPFRVPFWPVAFVLGLFVWAFVLYV